MPDHTVIKETKTLPILLNRGSKCPFPFNTLPSLKPDWSTVT